MSQPEIDSRADGASDSAVAALRRGREIAAPPELWSRIARSAAPLTVSWRGRFAAVAAGAAFWAAALHSWTGVTTGTEAPQHLVRQVEAAAPYLIDGSIDGTIGNELAAHTEVRLVETLLSAPESPR